MTNGVILKRLVMNTVLKILTSLKYKYLEISSAQTKYLKHTSETVKCSYVNFFPFQWLYETRQSSNDMHVGNTDK